MDSSLAFFLFFFSDVPVKVAVCSDLRLRLTCSIISKHVMAATKAMTPSAMPTFAPTLMPEDDFELGVAVVLGDVKLEGMEYIVDNEPVAMSKGMSVVEDEGVDVGADVVEIIESESGDWLEDVGEGSCDVVDAGAGSDVAPGSIIERAIVVVIDSESCLGSKRESSESAMLIIASMLDE